jgi:hypothetical protein
LLSDESLTRLRNYKKRISREDVIASVRALESEKQFPFSLLNDLRGYINYAPWYFDCFARLLLSPDLGRCKLVDLLPYIGFPTRAQRYTLVLFLLGAALNEDFSEQHKHAAINKLTSLLSLNEMRFQELLESIAQEAINRQQEVALPIATESKLLHNKLFVALRDYVDFLFLGEHSIGCEISPPTFIGDQAVLVRHFFNLRYEAYYTSSDQVTLIEIYDSVDAPYLYAFRGRLEGIKSYESMKFCYQLDSHGAPDVSPSLVIEELTKAVRRLRGAYDINSEMQLELRKMQVCSIELARLYGFITGKVFTIPDEIERTILAEKISKEKMREYEASCYSDLFFMLLKEGLDHLLGNDEAQT